MDYLHNHKDFPELFGIMERETGILSTLVEKDYWIMHVLHGLSKMGLVFELKGGTSLSKGYQLIHRFSEDIDIHIHPPLEFEKDTGLKINENPKNTKPSVAEARKVFYDWLASKISIDGIIKIECDTSFDDEQGYRSGGIRLLYKTHTPSIEGLKEGILLEAGFSKVTPFEKISISSWAYDYTIKSKVPVSDNRAIDIACYHHGYTFVEKLQTIIAKFRHEQQTGIEKINFMRQYYDLYCLLEDEELIKFLNGKDYSAYKDFHFSTADKEIPIADNEAFKLSNPDLKKNFNQRYQKTAALYYNGQPSFDEVLQRIQLYLGKL